MGIEVWQPYLDENKSQFKRFGSFSVHSFEVPHDNKPCVGYFIKAAGEKILYATDFEYIPLSFRKVGLNHLLIEANYDKRLLSHEADNRYHILKGHAEIQTTLGVVKDNVSDSLRTVILCHMSQDNAEPSWMVTEVKKVAPKAYVDFCRKGESYQLRNGGCPF